MGSEYYFIAGTSMQYYVLRCPPVTQYKVLFCLLYAPNTVMYTSTQDQSE